MLSSKLRCFSLLLLAVLLPVSAHGSSENVAFSAAPPRVDVFDYIEVTATINSSDAQNPFVDAMLAGVFDRLRH